LWYECEGVKKSLAEWGSQGGCAQLGSEFGMLLGVVYAVWGFT